jgi:excisionase family DNA binding protein
MSAPRGRPPRARGGAARRDAGEAAPTGAPDRLLSVAEAAALLGVGRSRLYDEIGAQRVRSVKVGRRRLVPSGAIAEYIASR